MGGRRLLRPADLASPLVTDFLRRVWARAARSPPSHCSLGRAYRLLEPAARAAEGRGLAAEPGFSVASRTLRRRHARPGPPRPVGGIPI